MSAGTTAPVEKRVDTLRRAAGKARDLANAATGDATHGWDALPAGVGVARVFCGQVFIAKTDETLSGGPSNAEHIASWSPLVALAAADLFEEFARLDDQGIHPPTSVVTLAKRYLGEMA